MATVVSWNSTSLNKIWGCEYKSLSVTSKGLFQGDDPSNHSLIAILMELGTAIILTTCLRGILKPLNQPRFVAQMLTGIMLGPSILQHFTNNEIIRNFHTIRQSSMMSFLEFYGIFLFIFLVGAQTDLSLIRSTGKLGWILGIASFVLPNILTELVHTLLAKNHQKEAAVLKQVASFAPTTSYHVTIILLQDVKLLNSEIGRLAVSSSIISNICSWVFINFKAQIMFGNAYKFDIWDFFTTLAPKFLYIPFAGYVLRPIMYRMIRMIPEGKSMKQWQFVAMIMMIFGVGFCNESLGYEASFGSLVLGMAVPAGPPLGSGMIDKANLFVSGVLIPSYLLVVGSNVNIFLVNTEIVWSVMMIVAAATVGKILAAVVPMKVFGVPNNDAFALGLILSSQGFFDVLIAKKFLFFKAITQEYFTVAIILIVLNASIGTTILKYIYDPSKRYINYKRRTIQHSRHETELKTLVCIHEEDDVFGLMNILKACYPTKKSPIVTYALDLMELVGRITPIFINHQFYKHQSPTATTNRTDRIISTFQQFETQYEGIKRYNFTAVAPYISMHDEICTLALDKGVSLLIIPFKKSETVPMRGIKRNVLDKAPCSVGILVNKKISLSHNARSLGYNVCLLFLGGPDSREALAFAMRMLENPATKVTVIRLIAENEFVSDMLETKLDIRAITELKGLFGDEGQRVQYQEVMVKDGAHTIEVLRNFDNEFDIMLVGRRVDADSLLVAGLADWAYESELGIVGDVLASTDMTSTAPVLVIQQQSTVEDLLLAPLFSPILHFPLWWWPRNMEIAVPWNQTSFSVTWHCEYKRESVTSKGLFQGDDPLNHTLIAIFTQLGTAIVIFACLKRILKPLNQPRFVAEMLTGIMLGPSVLQHFTNNEVFRSFHTVKLSAMMNFFEFFSIFLFVFLIGAQTDLGVIRSTGKLGWILGISGFVLPHVLSKVVSTLLAKSYPKDAGLIAQAVGGYPATISYHVTVILLQDVKLLNSEIGRLAVSSSVISNIISYVYSNIRAQLMFGTLFKFSTWDFFKTTAPKFLYILFAAYALKPIMYWMIRMIPEGKSLKQWQFVSMIMIIFGVGFFNESLGY